MNRTDHICVWRPRNVRYSRRDTIAGLGALGFFTPFAVTAQQSRCVLTPDSGEGPFYFDPSLVRSDIVDGHNQPDLSPLIRASESVGKIIKRGAIVVYESTVYPGCTEEVCVPIVERESGLKFNQDFFAGYSPERINPGDKVHRLTTINKVTSGSTEANIFLCRLITSRSVSGP